MIKKIWLDDMRPAPEGWKWVKDYYEAIAAWNKDGTPDIASLDHDLWGWTAYVPGVKEYSGYDFTEWLCEDESRWPPQQLSIHTDRNDGRENMARLIEEFGPYETREVYERTFPGWKAGGYVGGNVKVWGYIYYAKDAPRDPQIYTLDNLTSFNYGWDW